MVGGEEEDVFFDSQEEMEIILVPDAPSPESSGSSPDRSARRGFDGIPGDGGCGSGDSDYPPSTSGQSSNGEIEWHSACFIKNLDDGMVFVVDELSRNGSLRVLRELHTNQTVTAAEFELSFGSSPFIRKLMRRGEGESLQSCGRSSVMRSRHKVGWLARLGITSCMLDSFDNDADELHCPPGGLRAERIKVRAYKKRTVELTAVYRLQDFKAHAGAILAMKFSPDGSHLATGGEDGVVRVWRVMEHESSSSNRREFVRDDDPSSAFFTLGENMELLPVLPDDGGKCKSKGSKRIGESTCVVLPQTTFHISEEPVHEFFGHVGDILDLSWSENELLLSASTDKTVRLWKIGCGSCLKVFPHNNYVTCVHFNPSDSRHFISGCLDGMVRIWDTIGCRVVDWVDVKEIVTAVSYHPDAKGAAVGTITGNFRFYNIADNQLELQSLLPLNGKKKSPLKRITGFQYCPNDPKKLMIASADGQVRILDGLEVVSKYKGLRSNAGQIHPSFTSDGQCIMCAGENSNIYMWNVQATGTPPIIDHVKSVLSYEQFSCGDVSIAVPWNAAGSAQGRSICEVVPFEQDDHEPATTGPNGGFTLGGLFLSDRGSATWPEEQLTRSQFKLAKDDPAGCWGQVVVAGGWDGRVRTFQNYGLPAQL